MNTALIKRRLRELGMKQAEFAARCGVSKEFMNLVIQGHKMPGIPVLRLMAQTLDVTSDELIGLAKKGVVLND